MSSASSLRKFMTDLTCASEKAALIARACRREKDLFQFLIQEKEGEEKNARFAHDFKTLADVLIQETVRHDLGGKYPALRDNILGEESSVFTNTLGETIQVRVGASEDVTSELLKQVLDNHQVAADILSRHVHADPSEIALPEETRGDLGKLPNGGSGGSDGVVDVDGLGIWIDPIDSTNSYIRGTIKDEEYQVRGDSQLISNGLQVVTVLIGVFDKNSGKPLMGVINQPFARYDEETKDWRGQIYWGVCHKDVRAVSSSLTAPLHRPEKPESQEEGEREDSQKKVMISWTERDVFRERLAGDNFQLCPASGAGYKLLCVARGLADLYASSKGSTYRWDSCAGHALLSAAGGGVVDYRSTLLTLKDRKSSEASPSSELDLDSLSLRYHEPNGGPGVIRPKRSDNEPGFNPIYADPPFDPEAGIARWSNRGGLLAFRRAEDAGRLAEAVRKSFRRGGEGSSGEGGGGSEGGRLKSQV